MTIFLFIEQWDDCYRGKRYLAVKEPNLTWNCAITVKSREAWNEWRNTLFGKCHIS